MPNSLFVLPMPQGWSGRGQQAFIDVARSLGTNGHQRGDPEIAWREALARSDLGLAAAVHVIKDLASQGWDVRIDADEEVAVAPPALETDPATEKDRVRRQELLKRDEQLALPAVRRFIAEMERPREFDGKFVSIFSLMRDGVELAQQLRGGFVRMTVRAQMCGVV